MERNYVTKMLRVRLRWMPVISLRFWYTLVTWSFLLVMTSRSRDLEAYSVNDVERNYDQEIISQMAIDPYTHHKLPVLKMLKRQLRHFRKGKRSTLTLVFHSNMPVDIHWFQVHSIANEEYLFPILDGHSYFELSRVHSGDVVATTLTIPRDNQTTDYILETVLTSQNGTMQYQLRTVLDTPREFFLEKIDSPEWLVVPPREVHLQPGEHFERHCRSYVQRQEGLNALILMQSAASLTSSYDKSRRSVELNILLQTHDSGQDNHVEERGTLILEGKMVSLGQNRAVFDVKADQPDAERERRGLYVCAVERGADRERQLDKSYLLSYVYVGTSAHDLWPRTPLAEITDCSSVRRIVPKVVFREGVPGCLRCRGLGYPPPDVYVHRKHTLDQELTSYNHNVTSTRFVNVLEGGTVEAIYMFQSPTKAMSGHYLCIASTGGRTSSEPFDIKIKSRHLS